MVDFKSLIIASLFVLLTLAQNTQQQHCPTIIGKLPIPCNALGSNAVCAKFSNGTLKTFKNSCFACANRVDLAYYTSGACPVPVNQQQHCPVIFGKLLIPCNALGNKAVCVRYKNGTVANFQNSCFACATDKADIAYYYASTCY